MSKFDKQSISNVDPSRTPSIDSNIDLQTAGHGDPIRGAVGLIGGGLLAAGFYGVVYATAWAPLERYFLGHPVAVAATILFCIGISILGVKLSVIRQQWRLLRRADNNALKPKRETDSPTDEFRDRYDAGYVARQWSKDLASLPRSIGRSQLVVRLREVLLRQSGRGTTKHLADDLREISARDADSAHDSFALIRIIVWAIPMLGFLGTVIGITQTLGGLDFSNGNAAVDNLKSGLYVAFDTTALGLVLSIVAIFLQFPVERSEQQLLAEIDERVGYLAGLYLPGDEAADNQFELLAQLCEGVRAAVSESLSNQTKLWRETIDEAQGYWQQAHNAQAKSIVDAVEGTFVPALRDHAGQLELTNRSNREQLDARFDQWQTQLTDWQKAQHAQAKSIENAVEGSFIPALRDHAGQLEQTTRSNREQLDVQFDQWQSQLTDWQQSMVEGAAAMTKQQAKMLEQVDQAALLREQAGSVLHLQTTLAANLKVLDETNRKLDDNLGAAAGHGMADAMIVLARAVDILTHQMAASTNRNDSKTRRAA